METLTPTRNIDNPKQCSTFPARDFETLHRLPFRLAPDAYARLLELAEREHTAPDSMAKALMTSQCQNDPRHPATEPRT